MLGQSRQSRSRHAQASIAESMASLSRSRSGSRSGSRSVSRSAPKPRRRSTSRQTSTTRAKHDINPGQKSMLQFLSRAKDHSRPRSRSRSPATPRLVAHQILTRKQSSSPFRHSSSSSRGLDSARHQYQNQNPQHYHNQQHYNSRVRSRSVTDHSVTDGGATDTADMNDPDNEPIVHFHHQADCPRDTWPELFQEIVKYQDGKKKMLRNRASMCEMFLFPEEKTFLNDMLQMLQNTWKSYLDAVEGGKYVEFPSLDKHSIVDGRTQALTVLNFMRITDRNMSDIGAYLDRTASTQAVQNKCKSLPPGQCGGPCSLVSKSIFKKPTCQMK